MDPRFAEIRDRYLVELRALMPDVLEWWSERAGDDPGAPPEAWNDFERRWPAGPVAHPRVLDVVRRHFLEIDALNLDNERPPQAPADPSLESSWGAEPRPEARAFVRPIDVLVNDLERDDPDLFGVMGGLVFVPVGVDPDGEPG